MINMGKGLADRLLKQPPTTVVDLVMTTGGLKTGSEIIKKQRGHELEELIKDMGLIYEWADGKYLVARSTEYFAKQGTDSVSRGRWFGIPECCIQKYQKTNKDELRKRLSLEELKLFDEGESVPNEFYLGSMGYLPHSTRCQETLERGVKVREIMERIDPRLWVKFINFHIRRRIVEYGGEIKSWREAK